MTLWSFTTPPVANQKWLVASFLQGHSNTNVISPPLGFGSSLYSSLTLLLNSHSILAVFFFPKLTICHARWKSFHCQECSAREGRVLHLVNSFHLTWCVLQIEATTNANHATVSSYGNFKSERFPNVVRDCVNVSSLSKQSSICSHVSVLSRWFSVKQERVNLQLLTCLIVLENAEKNNSIISSLFNSCYSCLSFQNTLEKCCPFPVHNDYELLSYKKEK